MKINSNLQYVNFNLSAVPDKFFQLKSQKKECLHNRTSDKKGHIQYYYLVRSTESSRSQNIGFCDENEKEIKVYKHFELKIILFE